MIVFRNCHHYDVVGLLGIFLSNINDWWYTYMVATKMIIMYQYIITFYKHMEYTVTVLLVNINTSMRLLNGCSLNWIWIMICLIFIKQIIGTIPKYTSNSLQNELLRHTLNIYACSIIYARYITLTKLINYYNDKCTININIYQDVWNEWWPLFFLNYGYFLSLLCKYLNLQIQYIHRV